MAEVRIDGGRPVGPERFLRTMAAQVLVLDDITPPVYVIALRDKFGIGGARVGRTEPSERTVLAAMEHQICISQSATRRN